MKCSTFCTKCKKKTRNILGFLVDSQFEWKDACCVFWLCKIQRQCVIGSKIRIVWFWSLKLSGLCFSAWEHGEVHLHRRSCWFFSYPMQRCRTHTVSVFCKVENQNMRLFTQTVSQPRNREYCVFLHFVQKVLNFILLAMMFYLTIMDFKIFWIKVW